MVKKTLVQVVKQYRVQLIIIIIFLILGIVGLQYYNKEIDRHLIGKSTTTIKNKQYTFTVNNTIYSGSATSNARGYEVTVYYVQTDPSYNTTDNLPKLIRQMWKHKFISGLWKAIYIILIIIASVLIIVVVILFSDEEETTTTTDDVYSISRSTSLRGKGQSKRMNESNT